MNIVKYDEYRSEKKRFFSKHNNDFQCETQGSSAEYYRKTYVFGDGSTWYEVMNRISKPVNVEVNLTNITVNIDLLQTEYWNSDEGESKFYYEPWEVKS